MRPRSLDAVAATVGGSVAAADAGVSVHRVATDSRTDLGGALFAALPGERTDGHDHVAAAFDRGAAAALVSRDTAASGPLLRVADVGEALMSLAREERASFAGPVVGITGSSGKTCTKDFTAAALAPRFRVHASPRSFNTEVGVPLTILDAPAEAGALVLEMGSRGLGHIALLCRTATPTMSLVTNVGSAHLGMFGTRENIAHAKAEIVEALGPDGVAILNADDPVVAAFRARTAARVVTYGVTSGADVRAEAVRLDRDARAAFTLRWEDQAEAVALAVPGEHMVSNALAAAACALVLGVTATECAAALEGATVSGWRMEVHDRRDGVRVVNDAYNANPASVAAALKAARWMARDGRCVAVLGEMAELGEASTEEHDRLGELVARLGIEELVVVGELGRVIARGAVREGMEPPHVRECATPDDAAAYLHALVRPGDVVLVKASRAVGLERLALALAGDEAA